MKIALRSLKHGPSTLPSYQLMMDDLNRPLPRQVASFLRVPVEVARAYEDGAAVPHACQLALFWLTKWGQSLVDANATNDIRMAVAYIRVLESRLEQLGHATSPLAVLPEDGGAPASALVVRAIDGGLSVY